MGTTTDRQEHRMSETPQFMRDSIQAAIEAHLATTCGGFLHSFVYAAEATDGEGRAVMYLGGPIEQDTVRSLGLTDYLAKWYDDEARQLIARSQECHNSCCSDDEDD
jgi:hypothetical protein